jgi:uncharacterized membrane-anchored protein
VFGELVVAPPAALVFAIVLLAHGHAFAGVVACVFLIIALVQAVIYAPRALRAARHEKHDRGV